MGVDVILLLDRMKNLIVTSEEKHKLIVNRYLCLANRQVYKEIDNNRDRVLGYHRGKYGYPTPMGRDFWNLPYYG